MNLYTVVTALLNYPSVINCNGQCKHNSTFTDANPQTIVLKFREFKAAWFATTFSSAILILIETNPRPLGQE